MLGLLALFNSISTHHLELVQVSSQLHHSMSYEALLHPLSSYNPSSYFTSNTTVVFPPGHYEVSTEGQLVIQDVLRLFLCEKEKGGDQR